MQNNNEPAILKAVEGNVAPAPVAASVSSDNHIYFYDGVSTLTCLNLIRQVRERDLAMRQQRISNDLDDNYSPIPIYLHVQSYGGDLLAAFGAADLLARIETPLVSIVEGSCCSAATLLSMACPTRYITSNSFMLLHQFSTFMWGTHEQFKDDMKMQKILIKQLVEFYFRRSKLKREELRKLLKHDSWFGSKQALEAGLVHRIL